MTVDGFGTKPLIQQRIDISQNLPVRYLLKGNIKPDHKVRKGVHIVFHGVGRVVASFQVPTVVNDRVSKAHRYHPFL